METLAVEIIIICEVVAFLTVFFMHLVKENATLVGLFVLQSAAIAIGMIVFAFERGAFGLGITALLTVLIKAVIAPSFFFRLIARHHLKFSGTTYLSVPVTLGILILLTLIVDSTFFAPLASLAPHSKQIILLSVASLLISFFLMINRKGALSQIIGVLAFENSIVSFATAIELEQTVGLEFGVAFDLLMWVVIATVFVSMMYRHFGSLDVSGMKRLRE